MLKKKLSVGFAVLLAMVLGGATVFGWDFVQRDPQSKLGWSVPGFGVSISEHASLALFGAGLWVIAANARRRVGREDGRHPA
jgi:hypothetical protein